MTEKIYDLTQPFYEGMSRMSFMPSPIVRTLPGTRAHVQEIVALTHVGTHMDAPLHVVPDGKTIDEIPLGQVIGEGVIVDVAKSRVEPITKKDIENSQPPIDAGDIVFLYTGWGAKFGTPEYDPHPYLSEEAAEYLVGKNVKIVGLDTLTPDLPGPLRPKEGFKGPIHRILLGNGVLIIENLANLDQVAGKRLRLFAAPLKIRGGDGGYVRVFALEKVEV